MDMREKNSDFLKLSDLRNGDRQHFAFIKVIIIVCHYFYFNVLSFRRNILIDINNAENTVLPLPSDKDTLKVNIRRSFQFVHTGADTGLY